MVQVPAVNIVTLKPATEQTNGVVDERLTVKPELAVGVGVIAKGVVLNGRSVIGPKVIAWLAFWTFSVKLWVALVPIPLAAVKVRG